MNYLGDNNNYDDDGYWDIIEVSKVDDKIIKSLLNHLKDNISDNFFISFESLLKIARKIPEIEIRNIINELDESDLFKLEIFTFILRYIKEEVIEYHLLPQLYSPDFIMRAKIIMKIKEFDDKKYIKFLIPLLNDPDDSVRWSVIDYLSMHKDTKIIYDNLKNHMNYELNPIILENLICLFRE
ncbi:MAG: HEAT repeat domain-containing protein [Candidatus Lokiarchaeota archaeon]|nr:HEAT repeat domain-containing protein [Candidatus Lokiarchaeota archaeon]